MTGRKKPARKSKRKPSSPLLETGVATARAAGRDARRGAKGNTPPSRLIVGIGASAGGLEAYKAFLERMPADSGMAFVLVQHLDPHHKSMLVELLGRQTAMPVVEARDRAPVAANHVYVIPPDATLTVAGGVLRVTRPAPVREHRRPIDTFFTSLAEDQGENAVCIVLSGTGSDGTLGLRAVKEHGGLTLAQAQLDATAMSGMPHSAAATGLVDYILPVHDMPAALLDYRRHLGKVAGHKGADGTRRDTGHHLAAIFALLRSNTGHDFSRYKSSTLMRRIQRRMQVLRIDTVPAFVARLRQEPRQVELLFREFLIGVTQFFRHPQALDAVQREVLPWLLKSKGADDQLRIWIPGCATGEEVYSIAILVREAMERQGAMPKVQIFGTDIDDAAIAVARAARYRKGLAGLSSERLERWFAEDGEGYCPIKVVREMCVFSVHSTVKDPPFSRLDLISCRNLLIYMEADLQDRMMRTFHYALRPGGYLCLGPSENLTRNARLFAPVDKKHRIFTRMESVGPTPDFPVVVPPAALPGLPETRKSVHQQDRIDHGVQRIMEKHSPSYVVIDRQHEILRFSGGEIGRYLEPSPGKASLNLLAIVRKSLRPALRAAARKAYGTGKPVTTDPLTIRTDGGSRTIKVIVEPMTEGETRSDLCVVAFQDARAAPPATDGPKRSVRTAESGLSALEHELQTVKAQLQATIDELESANEEMKSSNEEYQSVNEELQSSNEELETAKEEMQSVNEELETVNAEMNNKNELLAQTNSDLRNLLESTRIATIFLDANLRVKSFTPGMKDLFHLREGDRGRPLTEIMTRFDYPDLRRDVAKVLRELGIIEREVQVVENKAFYMMRLRPYRRPGTGGRSGSSATRPRRRSASRLPCCCPRTARTRSRRSSNGSAAASASTTLKPSGGTKTDTGSTSR